MIRALRLALAVVALLGAVYWLLPTLAFTVEGLIAPAGGWLALAWLGAVLWLAAAALARELTAPAPPPPAPPLTLTRRTAQDE